MVGLPSCASGKESACQNTGDIRDMGSGTQGSGRSPGGGHGNSLQYSCLETPKTEESIGLQSVRHNRSDLAHMNTHITCGKSSC